MKKVLIIGLGRFGSLLAEILRADFDVHVWNRSDKSVLAKKLGVKWVTLEAGLEACDTIFYCVPISKFEPVFVSHLKILKMHGPKLIIDTLSVKVEPKRVLKKHLPQNCQAILTHPLFGPDSVKQNGLAGLKIVLDQFKSDDAQFLFWKRYFIKRKLGVVEMTAEEHDRHAAFSQGVVFFVGRVLEDFGFKETPVDTFWSKQLHQIVYGAVANDSWELFSDLQTYNPFTKGMRLKLGASLDKIYERLLPKQANQNQLTFGIQGGDGSFTHQALLEYLKKNEIKNANIKFLFTSEKVLDDLHQGKIDFGLMAIHNSVGGIVDETVEAMSGHKFKIVGEVAIPICHFMMKRKDVDVEAVRTIMTHPQVLRQCKNTLREKYAHLNFTSGDGDLIDHSAVAKSLMTGDLPPNIGVMGSEILAKIYDLEIIGRNLQDSKNNVTSFFGGWKEGF